jgi:hypothetical protein
MLDAPHAVLPCRPRGRGAGEATVPAWGQTADPCAPLGPPAGPVIDVIPSQAAALPGIVSGAAAGTTLRLADGTYNLGGALLYFRNPGVTLRSLSGNAAAVVLDNAYQGGDLIGVAASNVTIADLTVRRAFFHPIHVAPDGAPLTGALVHNVRVLDPGQQAVKINANGAFFADAGVVRCSHIELTDAGRPFVRDNCYTGGIDGHRANGWRVHDNTVAGFWCSTGLSEHGIHFWTGSRDTVVERNVVRNNARGIGLGLGQGTPGRTYPDAPCPGVPAAGHFRGIVRNNLVVVNDPRVFSQAAGGFDAGIALDEVCGAEVVHNSVFSTQAPFSSMEWRFPGHTGRIANNLVSHNLRPRDGATATLAGNIQNAPAGLVVDLAGGDLHLRPDADAAIDTGAVLTAGVADTDFDREVRDVAPDVGADEARVTFVDVPRRHWAWRQVEAAYAAGVTGGCATAPLRFCPDAAVTRAQAAVLLLRGKLGANYSPPPATGRFQDVPASDLFAPWVEDLAERGITGGCSASPPLFCPGQSVTRAQIAVFLLATDEGSLYAPPPAVGTFQDLPATSPFAAWAEELARRGVTGGCGVNPPRFCPAQPVTRAQAAVFVVGAFELPLP